MKRLDTFSGMVVTDENLDYLQAAKESAITQRYSDILEDGIFRQLGTGRTNEFDITPNSSDSTKFDIGPGVAKVSDVGDNLPGHRGDGERIVVSVDDIDEYNATNPSGTPPQSTGVKKVPLADDTLGVDNYVWLEYLKTENPGVISIHWSTGETFYVNGEDGYKVIVNTDANYGDNTDYTIYLGKIISPGPSIDLQLDDVDYENRVYVALNTGFAAELQPALVQYQKDTDSNGIVSAEVVNSTEREELNLGYIGAYDVASYSLLQDSDKLAQSFTPASTMDLSSLELHIRYAGTTNLLILI